ncbi:MAG: hypothetical protein ACI85O_001506 [Saprospiraceae bacterium]|jgi:hypothetical protein
MKTTAHILAIYLLLLSLIPCSDGGGGMVELIQHFFKVELHAHSGHDEDSGSCGDDFCSPFCVCNCCSIAIDFPAEASLNIKEYTPSPTTQPSFIPHEVRIIYPTNIWQPPRFS